MGVRRVVTGQLPDGKSVFVSDEEVPPLELALLPQAPFYRLWGGDEAPSLPTDGTPPPTPQYFPPAGGWRVGMFTVAPESTVLDGDVDVAAGLQELEAKLPGLSGHMEPDAPGMHTTDTVDFEYVVSGEVWLELDDGAKVHLKPGDTVVQNGTRHAWRNKGTEPATLVVVLIGAARSTT